MRGLTEQCRTELHELKRAEEAARAAVHGLDERIDNARVRACEREALAERLLSELAVESDKINGKPQLRKQLAPEPPKLTEEEIRNLSLAEAVADQHMIDTRGGGAEAPAPPSP